MNWKVLKTEEDYNKASLRMMEIFHAEPNTPQSDELDLLIVLIKDYDENHYQLPELDVLNRRWRGFAIRASKQYKIVVARIANPR